MKAVVLREFGAPEVLRLEDVSTPVPGIGEVLVEVRSVSVNRTLDLVVRALEAASTGKIRAIIDRTLPLREAAAAHRVLEEERVLGKIILDPKGK